MKTPTFDRLAGRMVMKTLSLLSRRAQARGDVHEAHHCDMQIVVGHSTHSDGWPCIIPDVLRVAQAAAAETRAHEAASASPNAEEADRG